MTCGKDDGVTLMTGAQEAALRLAARLFTYPDSRFFSNLDILEKEAEALAEAEETRAFAAAASEAIAALRKRPAAESGQRHVSIFDHTPAASLHLTWHRYGNDRSQGKAMAALNGLYRTAGFEPLAGEMPDYLPRMLEFLSVAPDWARAALLDGFGAEIEALLATLRELGAVQTATLDLALAPLRAEFPQHFLPRRIDPTRRPMAQPEPEPEGPLIQPPNGADAVRNPDKKQTKGIGSLYRSPEKQ